jgi:hypothetical protein
MFFLRYCGTPGRSTWPKNIIVRDTELQVVGGTPSLLILKIKRESYYYTCPARAPGSVHGGPGSMNIDSAFTGPPATGKDPTTKAHRPLTGPRLNLRARGCLFDARWHLPARIPRGKAPRGSPDTRTGRLTLLFSARAPTRALLSTQCALTHFYLQV